jgi:hypothetical protein
VALKKIGGLWKPDKPGKAVLTGKLDDGRKVYIFPNDKGGNEKRPDYNITVKVDDEPGADAGHTADDAWGSRRPADVSDDDVPFSVVALLPFLGMAAWIA